MCQWQLRKDYRHVYTADTFDFCALLMFFSAVTSDYRTVLRRKICQLFCSAVANDECHM